jgi:hypothetical protein
MYQVIIQSRILDNRFCLFIKNQLEPLASRVEIHDNLEPWEVGQLLGGN